MGDAKEDDFANQLSAMEGSLNKRLRERDETPPPSKKRCTQATPPTSANKSNGASNVHAHTHRARVPWEERQRKEELENLGVKLNNKFSTGIAGAQGSKGSRGIFQQQ